MTQGTSPVVPRVVALFNASDDTVEMVRTMLDAAGHHCLVGCHMADLKKGRVDFDRYLSQHKPSVLIFDISPPYQENWLFFKTLRDRRGLEGLGVVLTTTNKARLDETVGADSKALEIVGKPYDLNQINTAIRVAMAQVEARRASAADTPVLAN